VAPDRAVPPALAATGQRRAAELSVGAGTVAGMADFLDADLRGARFERVDLTGARFTDVDLSGAEFRGALDPALLHESVAGEWSFTETLRHLVFATDAWVRRAVLGDPAERDLDALSAAPTP
jgi:hypothetical protein